MDINLIKYLHLPQYLNATHMVERIILTALPFQTYRKNKNYGKTIPIRLKFSMKHHRQNKNFNLRKKKLA